MRVIFDGSSLRLNQSGAGAISYFEGLPIYQRGFGAYAVRQRGAGVGNVLRSLWRFLKPIASTISPLVMSAGKELGREGLSTTARILNKVNWL
jgi:hypothetical protein